MLSSIKNLFESHKSIKIFIFIENFNLKHIFIRSDQSENFFKISFNFQLILDRRF